MKKLLYFLCLVVLPFVCLQAQEQVTIKGTVLDKTTLEPIIGANVVVVGTTTGVITDFDGVFELRVPLNSELRISYVSYEPEVVKVTSATSLTIYLNDQSQMLDEMVVIGYAVQKKSDVTGAISSVSAKELTAAPAASPAQALQGKAAGVQVIQNSGAPGGTTTIKIRGTGTINDSDPLYVVDGFIVDNIDHINPNDIASMEVLKDAASASIYGSRSANGVVLITTKQGESGKPKISFDFYSGISQAWKVIDVMGVEDFALMRDYRDGTVAYSADGKLYYSKDSDGNLYFDEGKYQRIDSLKNNSPSSWWDAISRTGFKQQYNLSVSGGNEDHKYLISGNYYDEKGIIRTSGYQRFSLRMNSNNKITSWLTMRSSLLYTTDNKEQVPEGQTDNMWIVKRALRWTPLIYTYNAAGYYSTDHPLGSLETFHENEKNNRIEFNVDLTAKLHKYLSYQFKVANSVNNYTKKAFKEAYKLEENFVMGGDLTKITQRQTTTNKMEINNLLMFAYDKNKHDIGIVAGQTIETYSWKNMQASRQGTPANSDNYWYLTSGYYGDQTRGTMTEWSAIGFLGRLNYAFDNKYLLQVNFRADASSKFSPSERWGYFPSASVGWKFTGEDWMQNQDIMSFGKIRLGWGQLGNNRIDEYARYTILTNGYNYSYGTGNHSTQSGAAAKSLGNEKIRWEKTETYNIGLDMNFFKNRLTTTLEYFDKKTTDMLLRVPVTLSSGLVDAPMVNAGAVRNRGAEFLITYKDRVGNFGYEIGFNLSYIKNEVTSLGSGNEPIYGTYLSEASIVDYVTKTEVGMPIGYFYGYVTDGIFQNEEEILASAQNDGTTQPGDFRFKDLNNDGKIDAADRTYLGSPHPDFVFGMPINLSYKNFELNMFLQGQWGNKIFNATEYYLSNASDGNVYADLRSKHWSSGEGDRAYFAANPDGTIPDLRITDRAKNFRASDFYVKDGSYLRMQNIRLNYNLPTNVLSKIHLGEASVYVSAQNLFTITKYNGMDPEVGRPLGDDSNNNLSLGVDQGNYPQARTFTFGFRVVY